MNYLIRTTNKRLWYVKKFLIPEMLKHGIKENEIYTYKDNSGNLSSFINMCNWYYKSHRIDEFVWILQDDVMISDDFHEITFNYRKTEANGFCSGVDNINNSGYVPFTNSWLSFQCKNFRVDKIELFLDWYKTKVRYDDRIKQLVSTNKHDDLIYQCFEKEVFKDNNFIWNLSPNLVEHVDDLVGGSLVNKSREFEIKSQNFKNKEKIKNLKLLIDSIENI